jgi:hypothetical protein
MTAAPSTATDLKSALEEMRARAEAGGTRGVQGAIEKAILGILSLLLKMVEDFRAGRLAPIAPVAEAAGDGTASPPPRPSPARAGEGEVRRGSGVENGDAGGASWRASVGGGSEAGALALNSAADAAAGDAAREVNDRSPPACPSPSRCAGPSRKRRGRSTRPCSTNPDFAGVRVRARRLHPGTGASLLAVRCALPARRRAASRDDFLKNANLGGGIRAGILFQDRNGPVTVWRCRNFFRRMDLMKRCGWPQHVWP